MTGQRGAGTPNNDNNPTHRPTIETVQHGYRLVDCPSCGVIGVWQTARLARTVRDEHRCGDPTATPGRVRPTLIVGPPPSGQEGGT